MHRRAFLRSSGLFFLFPSALVAACRGADGAIAETSIEETLQALGGLELVFNQRITGRDPFKVSSDARALLEEAVASGRPLRPLGGGHGYLGNAVVNDGLVLDFRPFRAITIDDTTHRITIQAGARFVEVYESLRAHYGAELPYVLPTGDCPTVGVAGYTLGGGYGHLSRSLGLFCDNVVALRCLVVALDGRVVEKELSLASSGDDADLFWALRGGGGARFAVVTDFTFQLRQRPAGLRIYDLRLRGNLAASEIERALGLWLAWARERVGDETISTKLALGSSWFHLSGLHQSRATIDALRTTLADFVDYGYPEYDLDFRIENLTRAFKQCASLDECAAQPKKAFAAKSAFLDAPPLEGRLRGIAEQAVRRRSYATYGGIELMAWRMRGGVDTNNAFLHRDHDFLCQFYTEGPADERDGWMVDTFQAVTGQDANDALVPGYQNYADGTIEGAETGFPEAYFPSATVAARLRAIRERYRDVFTAP